MYKLLQVLRILLILGLFIAIVGVYYEVLEATGGWKQEYELYNK